MRVSSQHTLAQIKLINILHKSPDKTKGKTDKYCYIFLLVRLESTPPHGMGTLGWGPLRVGPMGGANRVGHWSPTITYVLAKRVVWAS